VNSIDLPIGVFDSGVGGLTVVKAIRDILPNESIIYFGDLAHLPYGSKGAKTVRTLALNVSRFLYNQGIKMLVVACNTATSNALPYIISEFKDIPVIGVVEPGSREALSVSEKKRIGVIGTTRTISSNSYLETITSILPTARVFLLPTPTLVPLIEDGWINHPSMYMILDDYLSYFDDKDIDTLLLGCTHYPLIKKNIRLLRPNFNIVDSADSTAKYVKSMLEKNNLMSSNNSSYMKFFASDISEVFIDLTKKILGDYIEIKTVEGAA